jgi:hypothetical protein
VSERIAKLKDAVERKIGGKAAHIASTPIIETFRGEVIWDGVVQTFDLALNPKAKRCYAWSYEENGETQYVTILQVPPVDSPEMAVKTYIASTIQR